VIGTFHGYDFLKSLSEANRGRIHPHRGDAARVFFHTEVNRF
jgi:hypothetical protein